MGISERTRIMNFLSLPNTVHMLHVLWFAVLSFAMQASAQNQTMRSDSSSRSGVALAVSLPDADPRHREMAAGIVSDARRRWTMLKPQLAQEAVSQCAADEKCLLRLAKTRDASHLLSVGIAALDRTDFVVSVKLTELKSGREVVSHADIGKPGFEARDSGVALAKTLFDQVAPKDAPEPVQAPGLGVTEISPAPSWRAVTGWTLIGLAAVVGGATAGLFFVSEEKNLVVSVGSIGTAALGCAGLGLLVWNELE